MKRIILVLGAFIVCMLAYLIYEDFTISSPVEHIRRFGSTAEGVSDWYPMRSWVPRNVEGRQVWFKLIECKHRTIYWFDTPQGTTYEYRLIKGEQDDDTK